MRFITRQVIIPEAFFLLKPSPDSGALATFFGVVRDTNEGHAVKMLYYECYQSMADKKIASIRENVLKRRQLTDVRILHRVGLLEVGDIAIAVAVTSGHRAEAFAACQAVVDEIKSTVPIWKKEFYQDGRSEWVMCRHSVEVHA
jgi:molybdopterin synthase catalytic subunit